MVIVAMRLLGTNHCNYIIQDKESTVKRNEFSRRFGNSTWVLEISGLRSVDSIRQSFLSTYGASAQPFESEDKQSYYIPLSEQVYNQLPIGAAVVYVNRLEERGLKVIDVSPIAGSEGRTDSMVWTMQN